MGRKICILGMGPSASDKAADIGKYVNDCEVWSLNNAYNKFPGQRFDRFFELHTWEYLKNWSAGKYTDGTEVDHWEGLKKLGCPIYVSQNLPAFEGQHEYPYINLFRHFGAQSVYWLGTPSLMLALALYEHDNGDTVDEIRAYGIDTSDPQHGQQRQSWAWWLSKAQERGIRLTGTALDFQNEYEKDAGLNGIRELVREKIPPMPPPDEFTVISAATESYHAALDNLQFDCEQCGLEFRGWKLQSGENETELQCFQKRKLDCIREALVDTQKPVLWIDADDTIITKFGMPTEGWHIGIIKNPERKVTSTFLEHGAYIGLHPCDEAYELINIWEGFIKQGINDHRALNMALITPPKGIRIGHLDPYLQGAIKVNPGPRNRPEITT